MTFLPEAGKQQGLPWPELYQGILLKRFQRQNADSFCPADHIDPAYGQQLRHARQQGVEILIYDVRIDLKQIAINAPVPVDF